MNELYWQIPLGAFSAVILSRLILAPYWMYKDKCLELATVTNERNSLAELSKGKDESKFSILWNEENWFLQEPRGFRGGWKSEDGGTGFILNGNLVINSFKRILVENVLLNIEGQLFSSDWEAFEYLGFDEPSIKFYISLSVNMGKFNANIQGKVNQENYVLDEFIIEVPEKR